MQNDYLIDKFDRIYKQLQRPTAAVAKMHSSIQLSKTLQDKQLGDDEKVQRYVAELHRYLNISDSHTQQQQQQQQQMVKKSRKRPLNVNTDHPILVVTRPQKACRPQLRSDQSVAPVSVDTDDEDEEIFINIPERSASTSAATTTATIKKVPMSKIIAARTPSKAKICKLDWSDWATYKR